MDLNSISPQCFLNMNEFRMKNLHCDVVINVDGKKFPCHRLVLSSASTYFNGMFNTEFDESKAENITLVEEINAASFEEILNGIYTSKISITPQNAYHLWKAYSFLGIPAFEKTCVEYIEKNLPVDNLFEVCLLGDVLKEEGLLTALAKYLAENIVQLFKIIEFQRLPYDFLKLIFSQENLVRHDDTALSIIAVWAKEKSNNNIKLINELLETAKLKEISISMMAELMCNSNTFTGCQTDEQSNKRSADIKMEIVSKKSRGNGTMNVYMKAYNEDRLSKDTIVLEYKNLGKEWNPVMISNFNGSFDNLKTIVVENRQYFLAYDRNRNSWSNERALFWMVQDGKATKLREPPVISEHYSLAAIRNVIYLYCSLDNTPTISVPITSSLMGEKENVNNCVFGYNCDLDLWTSTPQIMTMVKAASPVVYNNLLYVIGGLLLESDYEQVINEKKNIQKYDYRIAKWNSEPGGFHNCYASACVHENKAYVTGSYYQGGFSVNIKEHDFIAGKGTLLKVMNIGRANHTCIPYNNSLYAMDNRQHNPVGIYDVQNNSWNEDLYFPKDMVFNGSSVNLYDVMDAIVHH